MRSQFVSSSRKRMPPVTQVLTRLFALLVLLGGAGVVYAQALLTPLAGEYPVSGALGGDQARPALAFGPAGGYVVWQDNVTDGDGTGISAQRLNDNLSGTLAPFRVNQTASGYQEHPQVAVLPNGGAVFVWQGGALGFQKIYARFLNPDGTFSSGDILVGADTNQPSQHPVIAVLPGGDVVVAWSRMEADGHLQGVLAQRFSGSGAPLGTEWIVNNGSNNNQSRPAIAALADGGFVIAWMSEAVRGFDANVSESAVSAHTVEIVARRFTSAGQPVGAETAINATAQPCANPALSGVPDGGFVAIWEERAAVRTNSLDIVARGFDASFAPLGGPAIVNTTTYGDQYAPRIAANNSSAIAVWTSLGQDGSLEGIFARALTAAGTPVGQEVAVNSVTLNRQNEPAVAADNLGRMLVVWSSFAGAASGSDLRGQRYATGAPVPAPPAPSANPLSQSRISVTWALLAGYDLLHYAIYVDGSTNALTTTNQMLVVSNLVAGSSHSFRLEYVLRDGRRSALSAAVTTPTWGEDAHFDGLPDDWQARFWGPNPLAWPSGGVDSDGDGATNLQEFLAGTNPVNAGSALRLGMTRAGQGMWLNWNTEPGFVYQVQYSTNATQWHDVGTGRFAPGAMDEMQVPEGELRLYRILRMR